MCFTYIIKFIVRGIITFLNKGADMLQKAFFKVDVVDRIYDTPVFEKTTPGEYEFIVPEEYNYVVIEYAGAGGASATDPRQAVPAGKGAILKTQKTKITNKTITGIIASAGKGIYGGSGYNNGDNGRTINSRSSGGGGASSSVEYAGSVLVASGGAGQGCFGSSSPIGDLYHMGGKGGGTYGGVPQSIVGSNDATDPDKIGLNSGDGYVKIWAGYDPYFKG